MEYNEINDEYLDDITAKERNYYFAYTRLVDGVPFPDNGVGISYDNVNGEINSFSLNWYNIEFPSVDNVISLADAHEVLFDKIGLVMEYRYGTGPVIPLREGEPQESAKAALVYALSSGKPLYIDANSGKVVYNDGREYVEPKRSAIRTSKGILQRTDKRAGGVHLSGRLNSGPMMRYSEGFPGTAFKDAELLWPIITEKAHRKSTNSMHIS